MDKSGRIEGMFVLAGPTASGKSAVASELARVCAAEVVNLDPYQAFAGMEILTAQPGSTECSLAPHHLYGFLDPAFERDAASFAELAAAAVTEIRGRGNKAILVSGSGLYLRAFCGGLDTGLPPPDPELRARLEARPLDSQLGELRSLDPEEWEQIDRRNPRRVTRALEICLLSGRTASSLRRSRANKSQAPRGLVLWPEAEWLKARIRARSSGMFGPELAAEVARLEHRPLGRAAASTLGLTSARAWLAGDLDQESAAAKMATLTWQYARRQRTWFKKAEEFARLEIGAGDSPETIAGRIKAMIGW